MPQKVHAVNQKQSSGSPEGLNGHILYRYSGGGGVRIRSPIENTQLAEKSGRTNRSRIRKSGQLERIWNALYFIASEHSRGKFVKSIHLAINRQSGSHLFTAFMYSILSITTVISPWSKRACAIPSRSGRR